MPLSDEEARMLQQLEQSLAAEDPEFASTLRGSKMIARNRKVAALAALGFLAGLGVMFAGVVVPAAWLGVLGFVAMLGSAYAFSVVWKRGISGAEDATAAPRPRGPRGSVAKSKSSGSFVDRMEERWQRRQDGDDR